MRVFSERVESLLQILLLLNLVSLAGQAGDTLLSIKSFPHMAEDHSLHVQGIVTLEERLLEGYHFACLKVSHLLDVVDLLLDCLLHFEDFVLFARSVHVVVALVFVHVTAAHHAILLYHLVLELSKELIVDHLEGLDRAGSLRYFNDS